MPLFISGLVLDSNFNIEAGAGKTEVNDVLGFLESDAGNSEQSWTTNKFDPIVWQLDSNNSLHIILNQTNGLIKFQDVDFDFLRPEMSFGVALRDQAGLYGFRVPQNENEFKIFRYTINFPIGSGTVAVNHDGNLTDSAYAVKEFSSLNYHLPLEMSWADDNGINGNQVYYALKLAETGFLSPQQCTNGGIFCITECSGKILVVDHEKQIWRNDSLYARCLATSKSIPW